MTPGRFAELAGPSWRRILAAARRKVERTGELAGSVSLTDPDDAERHLVAGITGHYRPPDTRTVRVALADLSADLRQRCGADLLTVLAELGGPVRSRPAERAAENNARDMVVADARRRAGALGEHAWFNDWVTGIADDGTLTRLVRRGEEALLARAVDVLRRIADAPGPQAPGPRTPIPLPVLAELTTGDTKALAHTPLAHLVLRALALRDGVPTPRSRAQVRRRWEAAGVIVDDLASQVLVLNLAAAEHHTVARWLGDAAVVGLPFRLTLQQLAREPLADLDQPTGVRV